jgi:hypothetical protein
MPQGFQRYKGKPDHLDDAIAGAARGSIMQSGTPQESSRTPRWLLFIPWLAFLLYLGAGVVFAVLDANVRDEFVSGGASAVGLVSVGHGIHHGLRHFRHGSR